jgi:hypothetical protein
MMESSVRPAAGFYPRQSFFFTNQIVRVKHIVSGDVV